MKIFLNSPHQNQENVLKNKIIKIIKMFGLVSDPLTSINFTNKKKKHFFCV